MYYDGVYCPDGQFVLVRDCHSSSARQFTDTILKTVKTTRLGFLGSSLKSMISYHVFVFSFGMVTENTSPNPTFKKHDLKMAAMFCLFLIIYF